jgi:hypothetical protein
MQCAPLWRREVCMLRITRTDSITAATFRLEGKLLEPWLDELKTGLAEVDGRKTVILELAGLSYADASGALLLATLERSGVELRAPSPLLAGLIASAIR